MRFKLPIQLVLLLAGNYIFGQTKQFNLEECMTYAVENEANSVNATLDEEIAALRVKETVGIGLPQINGSANVQHNPDLPRFFSEYTPGSGFGISDADAQALGIQPGDVYGATNFFPITI